MKKNLTHLLIVILALSALVLTACGSGGEAVAPATEAPANPPASGGGAEPTAELPPPPAGMTVSKDILLDPANATDADSQALVAYVYETLFKVQGDAIVPVLAESYTIANDGLDYIIVLRPNVTFHDGTPLNADAVIANFDRWFDPQNAAHSSGDFTAWGELFGGFKGETGEGGAPKSIFDGAEKVDNFTVLIHLTTPDPQFIAKLNNPAFSIVSPAAFGADYFGTALGTAAGTGPYKVDSWTDTSLTLAPFDAYWGGAVATVMMEFQFK